MTCTSRESASQRPSELLLAQFKPFRNLCVLYVSAVIGVKTKTARGAENAEAARRLEAVPFLLKSFNLEILSEKFMTDR